HGRTFPRSDTHIVITAVRSPRPLGAFVADQIDATTLELRAHTYPEVIQLFDACQYPVLDRVQEGWNTLAPPSATSRRRGRRSAQASTHRTRAGRRRGGSHRGTVPH